MIGLDVSPGNQFVAALIASSLYYATYQSFVRLLRYPRNWMAPAFFESAGTGTLAILTVALVSLSAEGLDLTAFLVLTAFGSVLFFFIAAPAIAFRPASKLIEFLAKHDDYAALWLAGPALLAALTVPNVKLQFVLATAMMIELIWVGRQRWAGRHLKQIPLIDRDLSVLQTQAKGDLMAFKRRHGMRELVLTESAVGWKGCGKNTPPCPFNFYVNRLGLNTAPCCREHMKDLSLFVDKSLTEMGVIHWLEGGSLLGAVRENGNLLDWEDDIDISVLLDGDMTWRRLTEGLVERSSREGYFIDLFEKNGFVSISFDAPKRWPFRWERNRLRGEIRTDIAIYRKALSHGEAILERRSHKGAMSGTESGGYGVPQEVILPTTTLPFVGGKFACPNLSEEYLRILYGDFRKVELTYVDAHAAKARAEIDRVDEPSER